MELGAVFTEKVTSLGLSLADILTDFTVRGILVFWLDDEKTFEMGPNSQYGASFCRLPRQCRDGLEVVKVRVGSRQRHC